MANLHAHRADEVDALDGLVDALAVQNAAAELFDADAEQLGILPLYLAPAGFILGKIRIFIGLVRHVAEAGVTIFLRGLALARSAHRDYSRMLSASCRRSHTLFRIPGRSLCARSR